LPSKTSENKLELLLREINEEIMSTESRLQGMASRLGLRSWKELGSFFRSSLGGTPEADMLWPEYLYPRERLKELRRRKEEILRNLGNVR